MWNLTARTGLAIILECNGDLEQSEAVISGDNFRGRRPRQKAQEIGRGS